MDISEHLNLNTTTTEEEVEPYLEATTELVQKRRSQGRIIFDRFMRNKIAVGGAVFLILLILFCALGPFIWRVEPNLLPDFSSISTSSTPIIRSGSTPGCCSSPSLVRAARTVRIIVVQTGIGSPVTTTGMMLGTSTTVATPNL